MWAFLFLWVIITSLMLILILCRCTILIYLTFLFPLAFTALYIVFKNSTELSMESREAYFKNFRFGGHRGSPFRAPENTLESFMKSKEDGCDVVEFDIHMSVDGVPLVMHDDTTGRTGNIDLKVSTATWSQLNSVELKKVDNVTAKIPTLAETIDFCVENGLKMLFDMKNDNLKLIEAVAAEIKTRKLYDRVMVSSFNPFVPWRLKKIDGRIITGITLDRSYYSYSDDYRKVPFSRNYLFHWWNEVLDEINILFAPTYVLPKFLGVDVIMFSYRLICEETIRDAKERGFSVVSWTVNDPDYMRILSRVNVPFLTDYSSQVAKNIFMKNEQVEARNKTD